MPIEVQTEIRVFNQEQFHALDRRLMRVVFDVHNEFGRFLDEKLYKREIAARWMTAGEGEAEQEVRIWLKHESFRKELQMDLFFNHGLMLEAKTAETIIPAHRAQALNYLLLAGLKHGKLVNLRPSRVEHEFISTNLTQELRRRFSVVDANWRETGERSGWLRQKVVELLEDWGAFLEVNLYRDAITHFLGGVEQVLQPVSVHSGERFLGDQRVHWLERETSFAFTAVTQDHDAMREHQLRFLKHTPLKFIQWVNLNHHQVEFRTLANL